MNKFILLLTLLSSFAGSVKGGIILTPNGLVGTVQAPRDPYAASTQGEFSITIGNSVTPNMSFYAMSQLANPSEGVSFFQYANIGSPGSFDFETFSFTPNLQFTAPVSYGQVIDSNSTFTRSALENNSGSSNLDMGTGTLYYGFKSQDNNYGWLKFTDEGSTVGFEQVTLTWDYNNSGAAVIAGVPEPSALSLFAVGLGALALVRHRRS